MSDRNDYQVRYQNAGNGEETIEIAVEALRIGSVSDHALKTILGALVDHQECRNFYIEGKFSMRYYLDLVEKRVKLSEDECKMIFALHSVYFRVEGHA